MDLLTKQSFIRQKATERMIDNLLKQVQRSGFEVSIVTYDQLSLAPA
jgi:hypothetical protein